MIEYLGCWNTFRRQNILNIQKVSSCESKGKFKLTIFFPLSCCKNVFFVVCTYIHMSLYVNCLYSVFMRNNMKRCERASEQVKKLSIEQIKACSRAFSFLSLSTHTCFMEGVKRRNQKRIKE